MSKKHGEVQGVVQLEVALEWEWECGFLLLNKVFALCFTQTTIFPQFCWFLKRAMQGFDYKSVLLQTTWAWGSSIALDKPKWERGIYMQCSQQTLSCRADLPLLLFSSLSILLWPFLSMFLFSHTCHLHSLSSLGCNATGTRHCLDIDLRHKARLNGEKQAGTPSWCWAELAAARGSLEKRKTLINVL